MFMCCMQEMVKSCKGSALIFEKYLPGIMTYDGLESCIINSHLYTNEGTISGENVSVCQADSITEEETSCSSSKNTFGSCYSDWTTKRNQEETDEWSSPESTNHTYVREKPDFNTQFTDVEAMKEKFAKLLLGEDVTGGRKGISSALAISNSITSLAGIALDIINYSLCDLFIRI